MMYKLNEDTTPKEEIRYAIIEALQDLSATQKSIVVLDADLMSASGIVKLQKTMPERVFNLGIMEANMIGMASGLSLAGFIPFVHTFSPFAFRKCLDQIFLSSAYSNVPITMLSSDPGLCSQTNGGSHTALEDIGTLNSFENVKIYDISDSEQAKWAVEDRVINRQGFGYIRYPRRPLKAIYQENSTFTYGKAPILLDGNDVGIFASGLMLSIALDVAKILQAEGMRVRLLDCFSISQPDVQEIVKTAEQCRFLFSLDNHNIRTGLGSIIANVLVQHHPKALHKFGVQGYSQVGELGGLLKLYKLDAESISEKIKSICFS